MVNVDSIQKSPLKDSKSITFSDGGSLTPAVLFSCSYLDHPCSALGLISGSVLILGGAQGNIYGTKD